MKLYILIREVLFEAPLGTEELNSCAKSQLQRLRKSSALMDWIFMAIDIFIYEIRPYQESF